MTVKPQILPGDWTALAMAKGVPRVTRRTSQETAKRRLAEWLLLELLRVYGPPPGWTEQEYLADVRVMHHAIYCN